VSFSAYQNKKEVTLTNFIQLLRDRNWPTFRSDRRHTNQISSVYFFNKKRCRSGPLHDSYYSCSHLTIGLHFPAFFFESHPSFPQNIRTDHGRLYHGDTTTRLCNFGNHNTGGMWSSSPVQGRPFDRIKMGKGHTDQLQIVMHWLASDRRRTPLPLVFGAEWNHLAFHSVLPKYTDSFGGNHRWMDRRKTVRWRNH
jgi:hypothetical protein